LKLKRWASIAEISSAVAVVLSLIFVGLQIRDNTIATQAATYQDSVAYDIELLLTRGTSPDGSRLFWAFLESPDSLTEDEFRRGRDLVGATMRHLENIFLQREAGMLSDDAWSARQPLIRSLVFTPGFSRMTSGDLGQFYGGPFLEYAKEIRAESMNGAVSE